MFVLLNDCQKYSAETLQRKTKYREREMIDSHLNLLNQNVASVMNRTIALDKF